jgi:hypothetical protein
MLRERVFRKKVPDFPRDRRPDALDGVSIEEILRRQDALRIGRLARPLSGR